MRDLTEQFQLDFNINECVFFTVRNVVWDLQLSEGKIIRTILIWRRWSSEPDVEVFHGPRVANRYFQACAVERVQRTSSSLSTVSRTTRVPDAIFRVMIAA